MSTDTYFVATSGLSIASTARVFTVLANTAQTDAAQVINETITIDTAPSQSANIAVNSNITGRSAVVRPQLNGVRIEWDINGCPKSNPPSAAQTQLMFATSRASTAYLGHIVGLMTIPAANGQSVSYDAMQLTQQQFVDFRAGEYVIGDADDADSNQQYLEGVEHRMGATFAVDPNRVVTDVETVDRGDNTDHIVVYPRRTVSAEDIATQTGLVTRDQIVPLADSVDTSSLGIPTNTTIP